MDNNLTGLSNAQASKSALKIKELAGCFIYALVFTFCLYKNSRGITYPFFVGATLYFFDYILKKYGATSGKNTKFLKITMLIISVIVCTTTSEPIIIMSKMLLLILFAVFIVELMIGSQVLSISAHIKSFFMSYFGAIEYLFSPISDVSKFFHDKRFCAMSEQELIKQKNRKKIASAVFIGIVISCPAVILIVALLCSADVLFSNITEEVFDFLIEWNIFRIIFKTPDFWLVVGMIAIAFLYTGGFIIYQTKKTYAKSVTWTHQKNWDSYIAITFSSIICAVYLLFCFIQIFGLFLGKMQLPKDYTYSSYAREGFFQLLFVCLFNIVMVLCCISWFRNNTALKVILTVISVCTYIMTASSAYRMILYITWYQLTFLRLLVLWGLAMIAIVMAGVIYSIYKRDCDLFRYIMTVVSVGFIVFACARPDFLVAKYNIDHKNFDIHYLTNYVSVDAAPAIFEYAMDNLDMDEETKRCIDWYMDRINNEYETTNSFFNKIRKQNIGSLVANIYKEKYSDISVRSHLPHHACM